MPSESVVSNARLTASFATISATSDMPAIASATFIASSIRLAAGTTRATSPERSASAASIMRPVKLDRKSTRLNSSHTVISYAVFCLKKKKNTQEGPGEHAGGNGPRRTARRLPAQTRITHRENTHRVESQLRAPEVPPHYTTPAQAAQ